MKIYLAGFISGQEYEKCAERFRKKQAIFKAHGFEVFMPLTSQKHLRVGFQIESKGYTEPPAKDHAIFERDKWMVEQADIIFVDMIGDETKVSIGMMMELAWASLLGKHTVACLKPDNPFHHHAFVYEAVDVLFEDRDEAIQYIIGLKS